MKHVTVYLAGLIAAALLVSCNNFFHELVPPDGDRIVSFKIPGQLRAEMISDDSVMVTMPEGTDVRGLLPEITVSPRAAALPVTFNYLQTAFPNTDILEAAIGFYTADNPEAYIENLIRGNKDFNVPALDMPIDFSAPVDIYVIAAVGNIRRYTVYVSVENEINNNPGYGIEWPRLLGMGFSKANNPGLYGDSLCRIYEDSRTVNATVRYMPDSGFSFALVPTFVIWGDGMEIDGVEAVSDAGVIQFETGQGNQTKTLTLRRGANAVSYTMNVTFTEDLGANGPMLEGLRFAKYDNPELVMDAVCNVFENSLTVSARAYYPVEMPYLSFTLVPSFNILGDRLEVDGVEVRSGDETGFIRFAPSFGSQNKTLTVWRNGKSKDYALTITFEEDPDTVRSITDFRFVKQDNSNIAANAVAAIVNTDNTGAISAQVFYSGVKPSALIPRFVSPGNVSVSGAAQTSGVSGRDFSSPLEYRVVSRNGQYTRTYTVRVEFISLADAAPRITSFKFSQIMNSGLVRDCEADIHDDTGIITVSAYYGGAFAPETLTPEFSAEGQVQVMGSMQVSAASPQDFSRPIRYTVTHPLNSLLKREYWVYASLVQDVSSHAVITEFGFHPSENPGLRDELKARIDQMTGKITIYAPIGSGVTSRTMYPRFTAAGNVIVGGELQVSGQSGQSFGGPVVYTVISANGLNKRDYTVDARELTSTMYVNQNAFGSGDGTSWENAFRLLQTACEAAAEFPDDVPVEIWIAKGTYRPANTDDYFWLTANTSYIGGFAGYESAKNQRNIAANVVTISGDLGGGVYARRLFASANELGGDLSFENLRLTGARGQQGACVYALLDAGSELSLADCEVSNMQSSGTGGVVYVRGGGLSVVRSAFSACTNGAVYVSGTRARITDVEFSNCTNASGNGGSAVVRLDCSGETQLTRVNAVGFSGAAFYLGGNGNKNIETLAIENGAQGLSVQSTAGAVRVNGLVLRGLTGEGITMSGANGVKYFSGVTASNISDSAVSCSSSSGTFTMRDNSTFDNTGSLSISNGSGTVSVLNTKITNSKGASALDVTADASVIDALTIDGAPNGRGIYITNNGSANIANTVIKNCVTTENGGGIYIGGTGSANISYTTITACTVGNYGGGMYLSNSGDAYVSNTTIDTVKLTVSGLGGGIHRSGGSLSVENSVIKNVTGGGSNCAGIYYYASANLEVTDLVLQNINGSGIYSSGGGVRKFSDIRASNIGGDYGVYAVSMSSGSFTLSDSNFDSCGVYCSASGAVPVTVTDTKIYNASGIQGLNATSSGTGAVTIERVTIDGVPNGRGINVSANSTVRVSNLTVKNCVTTNNGGGIYIDGAGSANISNTTITVCTAGSYGGGMYIGDTVGGVNISNTTISGNTTSHAGGGVYVDKNSTLIMRNGTVISDNFVVCDIIENSFGGGLYISGGTFIMEGGTISGNSIIDTVTTDFGNSFGGGVCIHSGGSFTMRGGTISGNIIKNYQTSRGGGVAILSTYAYANSSFVKTGGTIYGSDGGTNANKCMNTAGALSGSNSGHAVYISNNNQPITNINSTVGEGANLTY